MAELTREGLQDVMGRLAKETEEKENRRQQEIKESNSRLNKNLSDLGDKLAKAIEAGDTGGSSSSLKISTSKCEVIPASNSSSLFEVSQADGTVVLSVNTTNKNIGIRTDAPDHPLEISHTDTSNISGGNIADNSAIGLHIDKTGDNDGAGSVIKLTSNSDACQSAIAHIQVDDNDADLAFYTDNSGTLTEAMRIDNGQKIGVGLISPEGTLHVSAANKAATAAGIVIIDSNSDVDDTLGAKGGSISFGGVYHNNGSRTEFAGISGRKSNNTSKLDVLKPVSA